MCIGSKYHAICSSNAHWDLNINDTIPLQTKSHPLKHNLSNALFDVLPTTKVHANVIMVPQIEVLTAMTSTDDQPLWDNKVTEGTNATWGFAYEEKWFYMAQWWGIDVLQICVFVQ